MTLLLFGLLGATYGRVFALTPFLRREDNRVIRRNCLSAVGVVSLLHDGDDGLYNQLRMSLGEISYFLSLPETSTIEMEIVGHCSLLQFCGGFWYIKPGGNDYEYS